MIPEALQNCLIKELNEHFSSVEYKNLYGKDSQINIFAQDLPTKKYEEDKDVKFPFIVVELQSGEVSSEQEQHACKVNFIIGATEIDEKENGYSTVFSIINKIYYLLLTKRVFDKQYTLEFPISWEVVQDETGPFYYGSLETNWSLPRLTQTNKEISAWL